MKTPRYFAREFKPGCWTIHDRQAHNAPIYDNGGNHELTFHDSDAMHQCLDALNALEESEEIRQTLTGLPAATSFEGT
jgi:hypothetical protein